VKRDFLRKQKIAVERRQLRPWEQLALSLDETTSPPSGGQGVRVFSRPVRQKIIF